MGYVCDRRSGLEVGRKGKGGIVFLRFCKKCVGYRTYLPLATGHRHVDEAPGVGNALLRAALGGFLLLLRFDLFARAMY